MIHRFLGSYKKFQCTADACKDTCCSGWEIEIDEIALSRYQTLAKTIPAFSEKVNYKEACFHQRENGDCTFLKENGLCEMILSHGEAQLCDTCRLYPRHIEEFLGVREYSLSVSCPETALELLSLSDYLSYTEETDSLPDDESLYEDYDEDLYNELTLCREHIFSIIKNASLSFSEKCRQILLYMKEKQYSLYDEDMETITSPEFLYKKEFFDFLFQLDPLKESWTETITNARKILFGSDAHPFSKVTTEGMVDAFLSMHPSWQIQCENLLLYFIFTYTCGAVYDDYVYAMSAQAVYNTTMLILLWTAEFQKNEYKLSIEKQAEILYRYSRELENSAENVILLEQLLDEQYY